MIADQLSVASETLGYSPPLPVVATTKERKNSKKTVPNRFPIPADNSLFSRLLNSEMLRDYHDAFEKSTGLSLSFHLPREGECDSPAKADSGTSFCAVIARMNRVGNDHFTFQKQLEEEARFESKTLKCLVGLCETAVPVRVGGELIAYLQTGGILVESPNQSQFGRITRELLKFGSPIDLKRVEETYFKLRVLAPSQYEAIVRLISIFATHLASCGGLMVARRAGGQPPAIVRACQIIDRGYREDLSLVDVAAKVSVCAGYFGDLFKKGTGKSFFEYLAGLRVKEAKYLLRNSPLRVCGVAFEAGFQSLSQFNRTFRFFTGVSPGVYRTADTEGESVDTENMHSLSAEMRSN